MSQYYSRRPQIRQVQPLPRQVDFDDEADEEPRSTEDYEALRQQAKRQANRKLARRKPEEPSQKLAPRSAMRYRPGDALDEIIERGDAVEMEDGVMLVDRQSQAGYYLHNGPAPVMARASQARASRRTQIPARAASQQQRTTDAYEISQQVFKTRRVKGPRLHWAFWIGAALLVMIGGHIVVSAVGTWWTNVRNYNEYGYPRTFQCDAVVGHGGDSPEHPSHFIVTNLHSSILIIEIPAGNLSEARSYNVGFVAGDQPDLTPVTLSFQDEPGSKGPAMLVHIDGATTIWLNNGSKFVAPSASSTGGYVWKYSSTCVMDAASHFLAGTCTKPTGNATAPPTGRPTSTVRNAWNPAKDAETALSAPSDPQMDINIVAAARSHI